jgi:hypothetical protein
MTAAAGSGPSRYIYNLTSTTFARIDTFTDSLQVLQSPPITPVGLLDLTFKGYDGYYSRAVSGTTTTIKGSFINGKICKGYKVRILEGANDGAERTITDVSEPIIEDYVVATTISLAGPISITDSSKFWQTNQWRGYQYRVVSGTGKGAIMRILYNNSNTIFFADANYLSLDPRANYFINKSTFAAAADATKTIGVIESQIATVDTPFNISIDDTSKYMVLGGAVYLATATTTAPFYTLYCYDVLSDSWSAKSAYTGIYLSQLGGTAAPAATISLERIGEYAGSYQVGNITSSDITSITDTSLNLEPNRYRNYQLRLANGQYRTIRSNTATTITVYRDFDFVSPVGTTYSIYADNDKLYMSGGGLNTFMKYSIQADTWSQGDIHDYGFVRNITVQHDLENALPVTSLTYTASAGAFNIPAATGYVVGTTTFNHNFKQGDSIAIKGVAQTDYNLTNVQLLSTNYTVTNFVYALTSTPADTTVLTTDATNCLQQSTVLMVDSTKNWITNEHRGKLLFVANNSGSSTENGRLIIGNTSTSLSSVAFAAAHASGSRYRIQDLKTLGAYGGIGNNIFSFTGGITNGTSIITNVSNISAFRLNSPIIAVSGIPLQTRVIGIEPINNLIRISANATGTATLTLTADETLTNGYGTCSNISVKRRNDIPIAINSITYAGGIGTATTFTNHGYSTGDLVNIRGVSLASANDVNYMVTDGTITVTGATTFTYPMAAPTNASATTAGANSTTQLVDSSKNWPANIFCSMRGKIITGTGAGQEFTINSNTSTALVFTGALATAPDSTSVYVIYPAAARSIGHILRYIGNNRDLATKGKYLLSVRGGNTSSIERFNITNNEWEFIDAQPLSFVNDTLGPGTVGAYDGENRLYLQKNTTHRFIYIDVDTEQVDVWGQAPNPSTPGTINAGNRCEIIASEDGLKYLYFQKNDTAEMFRTLLFV